MSIRKTIITTVVALTLVAMVVPGIAQGDTISDLLAQIQQLQTQLLTLQGGSTPTGTANYAGIPAGFTFQENLPVGTVDQDVVYLKAVLVGEGCGSGITNTTYYGPKTKANVQCFQNKYKAQISAFAGYTISASGLVGTGTRAQLNVLLTGNTGNNGGTGTLPQGCTSTSGYSPITGQSCATGEVVIPTGSGLTVQLAYDNPASNSVVASQSIAPLAKLTFVNGDNAPVKVTGFKINRTGVSGDSDLTNVYLFDGATRLTDAASVSSGVISFNDSNGIFTVNAGSSKTITVAADIYSSAAAGTTVGVRLLSASDITTNASSVKGNFPVSGNMMTVVAKPSTFGTVVFTTATLAPSTSFTSAAPAAIDPQSDYAVWKESVSIGNHAAKLTRISLREIGSINYTDLQNFRLFVDGVMVGSAVQNLDSNGYVTFDMTSNPVTLQTGSREIKVIADIVGGSNRNFTFSLRTAADATFIESQYNVNILPTVTAGAFTAQTTGYSDINDGTISIVKATDSPTADIVDLASNVVLGKFTIKAAGEKVKVDTLKVAVVCYDGGSTADGNVGYLRNGAIYANGVQIGSTSNLYCTDYSTTYTTFNLGSSLVVDPLTPVTLEVKADIYDADGTDDIAVNVSGGLQTLQAEIVAATGNGQGQTSLQTVAVPSTTVTANSLTVATGGLSLSQLTAFTAQAYVPPLTAAKIAHFTLTANTNEAVNINTIEVNLNAVASSYATNLYVKYGNSTTAIKSSVTAQNTWYVNYTLPAGDTIDLQVYADISSTAGGTAIAGMYVAGTTASSATSVTGGLTNDPTNVQGQNISFTTGTFTEVFSGSPSAQAVSGNQLVEVAKYTLSSSYQQYTVSEMRFTAAASAPIVSAVLTDGTTSKTASYDSAVGFKFTGLNFVIPANTQKTITLSYNLTPLPSSTVSTSGVDVKPTLTYVKRQAATGTVSTDSPLTYAAKSTYVYKSVPTLTQVKLTDGSNAYMTNGSEQDLYKFTVAAPAQGDVAVKQFKLALAWVDGGTTEDAPGEKLDNLKLLKNGVDITANVTIQNASGVVASGTTGTVSGSVDSALYVTWPTTTQDTILSGTSATYTLRGTPNGFRVKGTTDSIGTDSVAISFANDTATGTNNCLNTNGSATNTVLELYAASSNVCPATNASAVNYSLLWSDVSAVGHSADVDAASTDDWYTSYLLNTMGSQSWLR